MNAIQYAEKIADGIEEHDADSVSKVPVNVGDEEIVKSELERRGFKVEMTATYLDASHTQVARYILTVRRK